MIFLKSYGCVVMKIDFLIPLGHLLEGERDFSPAQNIYQNI